MRILVALIAVFMVSVAVAQKIGLRRSTPMTLFCKLSAN